MADDGALIDADKGAHVLVVGKKGWGKSFLARRLFDTYPYDSLVLDITGDLWRDFVADGTKDDPEVKLVKLQAPLPVSLPAPLEDGKRQIFVFTPDMGDPSTPDEIDRAIGLALRRGRMLIWGDEMGVIAPANKTGPNLRRYLHHGRHHQMTGLWCGPRPMDVDPLMVAQADHTFVFSLANPTDRRRIADSIGWPPKVVDQAVHDLDKHHFLHHSAETGELVAMPPLPAGPERQKRR